MRVVDYALEKGGGPSLSPLRSLTPLTLSCSFPCCLVTLLPFIPLSMAHITLLCVLQRLGELEEPCLMHLGVLRANATPGTAGVQLVFVEEIIMCQTFLLFKITASTQHDLLLNNEPAS